MMLVIKETIEFNGASGPPHICLLTFHEIKEEWVACTFREAWMGRMWNHAWGGGFTVAAEQKLWSASVFVYSCVFDLECCTPPQMQLHQKANHLLTFFLGGGGGSLAGLTKEREGESTTNFNGASRFEPSKENNDGIRGRCTPVKKQRRFTLQRRVNKDKNLLSRVPALWSGQMIESILGCNCHLNMET